MPCPSLSIRKPVPLLLVRPDDRVTRSLSGFHSENRDKDKKKPPTKNDQFIAILSLRVKDLDKLIVPSYFKKRGKKGGCKLF